jgi:hypothetical protein
VHKDRAICLPGYRTNFKNERNYCSFCLYFHITSDFLISLFPQVQCLNKFAVAFDVMITQVV